jgi:hypothetical protein
VARATPDNEQLLAAAIIVAMRQDGEQNAGQPAHVMRQDVRDAALAVASQQLLRVPATPQATPPAAPQATPQATPPAAPQATPPTAPQATHAPAEQATSPTAPQATHAPTEQGAAQQRQQALRAQMQAQMRAQMQAQLQAFRDVTAAARNANILNTRARLDAMQAEMLAPQPAPQ